MSSDVLRTKAKKGFIWNTMERVFANGIYFLFTVILARLLSPDDYGVIAMPVIFLALAQVLVDSGFANALIRKPDLNEEDLSTAFYFNVLVGIVCYSVLFVASPLIAAFFKTPILSQLLKVTALVVFLNSLGIVQQAIMTKRMDFKSQAIITVISTLIGGLIGVWMAYNDYGVWSLVFQQVSSAFLRTILLWFLGKWHPLWIWSKESFHYLWSFGYKVVIIGFMDTLYNNIYAFFIGKMYNAKDLGNYTRAQQFADLPVNNINSIIARVTFPLLSEVQEDNNRLHAIYLKLIKMTSLIIVPLMLGLAAIANPLILTLLGDEWVGCIVLFQILCIARIWTPFSAINVNLLQVKGRTDLQLKLEILKKAIITVVLLATLKLGVAAILIGFAFCTPMAFFINVYYTNKIIGVSLGKQFKAIIPSLTISLIMAVSILLLNTIIGSIYAQLIVDIVLAIVVYLGLSYILERETIKEIKTTFLKK